MPYIDNHVVATVNEEALVGPVGTPRHCIHQDGVELSPLNVPLLLPAWITLAAKASFPMRESNSALCIGSGWRRCEAPSGERSTCLVAV